MSDFSYSTLNQTFLKSTISCDVRSKNSKTSGCCGFFGLFSCVLKVVLPNVSPVPVAGIFREQGLQKKLTKKQNNIKTYPPPKPTLQNPPRTFFKKVKSSTLPVESLLEVLRSQRWWWWGTPTGPAEASGGHGSQRWCLGEAPTGPAEASGGLGSQRWCLREAPTGPAEASGGLGSQRWGLLRPPEASEASDGAGGKPPRGLLRPPEASEASDGAC